MLYINVKISFIKEKIIVNVHNIDGENKNFNWQPVENLAEDYGFDFSIENQQIIIKVH